LYTVQPAYRLFSIDGDETLTLIPLCARRALDALGLKLPLDTWQQLALADRLVLAEAGSSEIVDRKRALVVLAPLDLPQAKGGIETDPPDTTPPEDVVAALGSERPLVNAVWSALLGIVATPCTCALMEVCAWWMSRGKTLRIDKPSRNRASR
jgi:hypothetical protein